MPRQNRITPLGDIIATPARGTLLGNRGCLHDDRGRIRRLYQSKRWIFCQLQFKGRWRPVMVPGQYTHLFFLDEATALAAGHRPCAECLRPRFNAFRSLWAQANPHLAGGPTPFATTLDAILHQERITVDRQKVTYSEQLLHLPSGSFVTLQPCGQPYLVYEEALFAWSPEGYGEQTTRSGNTVVQVLTPRSVVGVLASDYEPSLHSSAFQDPEDY